MNTQIEVQVPHCESCGRPTGEYSYASFREEETQILEMLKPGLTHVDGMSTLLAAQTFDEWITQLVKDPLKFAQSSYERRGNWSDYGHIIEQLRRLLAASRQVKGVVNVKQTDARL